MNDSFLKVRSKSFFCLLTNYFMKLVCVCFFFSLFFVSWTWKFFYTMKNDAINFYRISFFFSVCLFVVGFLLSTHNQFVFRTTKMSKDDFYPDCEMKMKTKCQKMYICCWVDLSFNLELNQLALVTEFWWTENSFLRIHSAKFIKFKKKFQNG